MFDVFRIDEHHTGVYLADAVGHGMAAGLLTMFIKRVIIPKRIHEVGYEVVPPSVVLAALNDTLAEQELPNCQFVTACYGVIDHRASAFTFARGGHPHPLHVATDGVVTELTTPGGLLGLFAGAEFPERTVALAPTEKLVLVTDGIEHILESMGPKDASFTDRLAGLLSSVLSAPLPGAFHALEARLDDAAGFHLPQDDLTILAFEMPEVGNWETQSQAVLGAGATPRPSL
jgi:sigma-B regulation protein RsbU (phosphoserine phosphatase)